MSVRLGLALPDAATVLVDIRWSVLGPPGMMVPCSACPGGLAGHGLVEQQQGRFVVPRDSVGGNGAWNLRSAHAGRLLGFCPLLLFPCLRASVRTQL